MPTVLRTVAVLAAAAIISRSGVAAATDSASDLTAQAMRECEVGQEASAREERRAHFERGESLATKAVTLDDKSAPAHFAIVCNLGELLRVDGEKLTSLLSLRRLMSEVDRTLQLDPNHVDAMATKGTLLMRLPRVLGGNTQEGERLLREVVKRDDSAVTSRITLAKSCVGSGKRDEGIQLASRALEIARQEGRADKVAEAQATLAELGAGAQ
jgi:hypothetical protein